MQRPPTGGEGRSAAGSFPGDPRLPGTRFGWAPWVCALCAPARVRPPRCAPARVPEPPPALLSGASGTHRASRRHGARAARRFRARGAGASPARRLWRGPGSLGLLAERRRGSARAPRAGCGGRAAGGGERGEDGRLHPEAVLPHPGEASHQLHPAGPGEVKRRQERPAASARPGPRSPPPPCPPATLSPAAAVARAPSLGPR